MAIFIVQKWFNKFKTIGEEIELPNELIDKDATKKLVADGHIVLKGGEVDPFAEPASIADFDFPEPEPDHTPVFTDPDAKKNDTQSLDE